MTYGPKHIVGVVNAEKRDGFLGTKKPLFGATWSDTGNIVWTYMIGAHMAHLTEFLVAVICYFTLFADGTWAEDCKELQVGWISKVVGFNLACMVIFVGFWHWLVYMSDFAKGMLPFKFNKENQYEPGQTGNAGLFTSSTGHLEREVFYTTLGWLQSAALQCLAMHLWASGAVPYYNDFWAHPAYSIGYLFAITYWREVHFYFCHRGIHPWWGEKNGLLDGDIGAFLYRHVHSLHHKSYNPGPWSGLSMHPVEHFLYYSCAWVVFWFTAHPLHFLYVKFHADIAPIGGHDGYGEPSANGDFHYLHHARRECNYGVPWPVNFDDIFGTWIEYEDFKETGSVRAAKNKKRSVVKKLD